MAKSPQTGQSIVGLSLSPETSVLSEASSLATPPASPGDFVAGDLDVVGDFEGDLARGDFWALPWWPWWPFGDLLEGGFAGRASSG